MGLSYSLIWNEDGACDKHCQSRRMRFSCQNSTYLDLVPIFTGEGIQGLLLQTLLALRETLIPVVLSDSSS